MVWIMTFPIIMLIHTLLVLFFNVSNTYVVMYLFCFSFEPQDGKLVKSPGQEIGSKYYFSLNMLV